MASTMPIVRKVIVQKRKFKFRRLIKSSERCFAKDTPATSRKNVKELLRSRFELSYLTNSVFDRGWKRVNKHKLILLSVILFFLRCSVCSAMPKRVEQEVPRTLPKLNSDSLIVGDDAFTANLPRYESVRNNINKYRISNSVNKSYFVVGELSKELDRNVTYGHTRPKRKPLLISDNAVSSRFL